MRMRNYDCFSCLDATNISREAVCKFKTCNSATTARIKLSLNFCSAIVKSSPLLRPNVSNCIAHNKEAARECAERPYKQEPRSGCGRVRSLRSFYGSRKTRTPPEGLTAVGSARGEVREPSWRSS